MVEKYLGKEVADDIFLSSMISSLLTEKDAEVHDGTEKRAMNSAEVWNILKGVMSGAQTATGGIANVIKAIPSAIGWTALAGGTAGALGSTAYDVIKDRVSRDDPDASFNAEMESMYSGKKRELDDAQWMSRVIAMRDDLKRNYKKMTTEEYAAKYKALSDALDEKKELS